VDFARIHFAVEESLMRVHRYPELERHVREHLDFAGQIGLLQERSLRVDVSAEMVAFIQKWFHEHIMASDKHYAAHLPTVGVVTADPLRHEATISADEPAVASF